LLASLSRACLVAIIVSLGACNGRDQSDAKKSAYTTQAVPGIENTASENPKIARWTEQGVSMIARKEGTLIQSGGCLVLQRTPNDKSLFAVPYGSGEWDNKSKVFLWRGRPYHLGDRIAFGGGNVDVPTKNKNELSLAPSYIPECGIKEPYSVFLASGLGPDPNARP
jgi:hypothetical protein